MLFSNPGISLNGFSKDDILEIKSGSLYEASKILGETVHDSALALLDHDLKTGKTNEIQKCERELEIITSLAGKNILSIGNTNYAARYLQSLEGFAKGLGISVSKAAFLQKEIETGCQTMIARNQKGDIGFLHTEENDRDDNTTGEYNYKIVNLKLPEKEVVFFSYPGLCGWGPAFCIDKTNNYVQFVDDLVIDEKYSGLIWSNFIAFLLFDCGEIKKANLLLEKIRLLGRSYKFFGGYAVHMIQNKNKIENLSIEFGGKYIREIPRFSDFFVQVNLSKDKKLKDMTEYVKPKNPKKWRYSQRLTFLEMTRREERLANICRMGWWNIANANKAISTGLKVLAYPYGDLRRYKDKSGKINYYHTGLPSRWNFAHFIGYVGKESRFYIGKKNPAVIPGLEYNNDIDENYKYAEEKLWEKV